MNKIKCIILFSLFVNLFLTHRFSTFYLYFCFIFHFILKLYVVFVLCTSYEGWRIKQEKKVQGLYFCIVHINSQVNFSFVFFFLCSCKLFLKSFLQRNKVFILCKVPIYICT